MPSFQHRIAKVVPKCNYRHVEAFMRSKAMLDFLSPEEFNQLAQSCVNDAKAEPKKAEALAKAQQLRVAPDVE